MHGLRDWLVEPRVRSLDVNSPDFSLAHRRILQDKTMVRQLFEGFYRQCRSMDARYFGDCPGRRLEIGSGAGFMAEIYPDVITSDIEPLAFTDLALAAEQIPMPDESLRAIYAINIFHHLPDPRRFFGELLRILAPGGGVVLIEPYYGPLAGWLFRRLFASESFDPDAPDWEERHYTGRFSGANQALSYIVFKRDQARFKVEFPRLELLLDRPHTHLLYFIGGGVNFRQLAPDVFIPIVKLAERVLSPLNPWLAVQHTIVLRKRPDG
jgi:SAM-dependent methyltransferase